MASSFRKNSTNPSKSGILPISKGTFGLASSRDEDGKLFSLDRTLSTSSASDVRFPSSCSSSGVGLDLNSASLATNPGGNRKVSKTDFVGNQSCRQHHFQEEQMLGADGEEDELDDDEEEFSISVGLPSDLPSGLVDIEGNLIDSANVRFAGDGEGNDLNEDDDELSSLPDDFNYGKYKQSSSSTRARATSSRNRSRRVRGSFEDQNNIHSEDSMKKKEKLESFRNPHQFNDFIQLRTHRGKATRSNTIVLNNNNERRNSKNSAGGTSSSSNSTITQHYYPEGGWGYVVLVMAFFSQALLCGIHLSSGVVICGIVKSFNNGKEEVVTYQDAGWLVAASYGISLLLSPIWVSICKRKSTRLTAVFGGLLASLGCLFTSFATQFHQLIFSYVIFLGFGIGLTRDASSLMVGQYFKRKRDLVEVILVSALGFGILLMSASIRSAISFLGWRLGLQAITGALFLTFFLGTCYRSASLYHPQRRAILHLKNQKRKIVKEKEKLDNTAPPFLDFSCLRSKTLQILLLSAGFTAFGIHTPLFYLAIERDADEGRSSNGQQFQWMEEEQTSGLPTEFSLVILLVGIGISWIVGCFLFGLIVFQKNQECRVSKQYLCQIAGVISGISILALATTQGFNGLVVFSCVYGFSLGGYNYSLKVYTYERVRARHFPRAWSFIQASTAIPIVLGLPLAGYLNKNVGWKSGYYLSAASVIIGSAFLFLTDVRKRKLSRRKMKGGSVKTLETASESAQTPRIRRLSFSFPAVDQFSPPSKHESCGTPVNNPTGDEEGEECPLDPALLVHELTCLSEDEIPGVDFKDIYLEEWADYLGGDITSCNKVENCLVSEFDPEHPLMLDRRFRRWSAAKSNLIMQTGGIGAAAAAVAGGIIGIGNVTSNIFNVVEETSSASEPHASVNEDTNSSEQEKLTEEERISMSSPPEIPAFRKQISKTSSVVPGKTITVIDEDSSL